MNDEIISELHAVKDKLAAQSGYDIKKLIAEIRRGQTADGRKLVEATPNKQQPSPYQRTRFVRQ